MAEATISPVDYFEFEGSPTQEDLKKGETFGAEFARLIKKGTD